MKSAHRPHRPGHGQLRGHRSERGKLQNSSLHGEEQKKNKTDLDTQIGPQVDGGDLKDPKHIMLDELRCELLCEFLGLV